MKPYSPLVQNALNVSPLTPDFQEKYQSLIEMCRSNLAKLNEDLIWRAYVVAHWAHRNDNRKSGEPYFLHPIEVALITVRDIGMDDISVATALLHDTVEDTEVTLDMIRTEFGDEVALLINGLTKIDEVFKSKEISRAENWRKLILYMASDMRVIMVKFADRLHNMRTLGAKSEQAQLRTAHLPRLAVRCVFVHGTRDAFGTIPELEAALALIPAKTRLIRVEGAGHDLRRGRFDWGPAVAGLATGR